MLPFTVFVAGDFLNTGRIPWWMALEALVTQCTSIRHERDGRREELVCADLAGKRETYARLLRELAAMPIADRTARIEAICARHHIDLAAIARREMLSSEELKALGKDPLATIGSQGAGTKPLATLGFDEARDELVRGLDRLEAAMGERARHIAYPGTHPLSAGQREFALAAELGIETAVTSVEGALWPEHAEEPFALPRIALDNDPATLVRVLMLGDGASFESRAEDKAIA